MIKQNLKVAIMLIACLFCILLVILNFIKIDISTTALIFSNENNYVVSIENIYVSYIEKNNIDKIEIEYLNQYFNCYISYIDVNEQYGNYWINLPQIVKVFDQYISTNIIIDNLNVYQYFQSKLTNCL